MLWAAEVVPQDMTGWVVGLVLTGIVSILGFLAKGAVAKVELGIEGLGSKLDALRDTITKGDIARAVLETRVETLGREHQELRAQLAEVRRELRELSEGVAR